MSTEQVSVEPGTTEGTEDFVDLPEATDADIEAFLSEGDESPKSAEKPAPEPAKETKEPEPQKAPEPAKAEPKKDDPPPSSRERKLEAELKQARTFIDRRGTEIGELRKQLRAAEERLADLTSDEKWHESPRQAAEDYGKLKEVRQNLQNLDQEEQANHFELQARQIASQHLEEEEADFEAVAQMLTNEGYSPQFVAQFRQNPFRTVGPDTLVNMAKRAHREGVMRKIIPATQKLLEENIALKKQLSEAGAKTAQQIQRNLSRPAELTASQSTASASIDDAATTDFTQMNPEQLEEFLRRAERNGR